MTVHRNIFPGRSGVHSVCPGSHFHLLVSAFGALVNASLDGFEPNEEGFRGVRTSFREVRNVFRG
jgi:hypothetical protein